MNVLKGFYKAILKLLSWLIVLLATAMIFVVLTNVIARYFFGSAFGWADEVSRFLFIWISFTGAVIANDKSEHMNLDILVKYTPKKVGYAIQIFANIVVLIISIFLTLGGITIVQGSLDWLTPALEIPYGMVYSIVPVCCLLLAIQSIMHFIGLFKTMLSKRTNEEA